MINKYVLYLEQIAIVLSAVEKIQIILFPISKFANFMSVVRLRIYLRACPQCNAVQTKYVPYLEQFAIDFFVVERVHFFFPISKFAYFISVVRKVK